MKKINYIIGLLFAVLCMVFSACTDEHTADTPVVAPEGEGFLSISFSAQSSLATKGPVNEIDPWEHRVKLVWILLYNTENKLVHKYELKVQNYKDSSPTKLDKFANVDEEVILTDKSENLKFQSIAESVKRQQYQMVVLANPPKGVFDKLDLSADSPLSVLTTAISGLTESEIDQFGGYYMGESNSSMFFMSNANGLVTVPTSKLYPTKEEAHNNPVQVNIDRLLAKVVVQERKGGVNITTPDVVMDSKRPLRWYLDVTNKSTYLIRQFAHLLGGTEMETEANTPADRERIYARDPNFVLSDNNISGFKTWNRTEAIPYATWISEQAGNAALPEYIYVLENTFDLETQKDANWANYATRIVLDVNLIYKNLLWDPNDPENENDPNRNYYSYLLEDGSGNSQWRVFTQEQAAHWLDRGFPYIEEKDNESASETAARLEEEKWVALLEAKIKEIQSEYVIGGEAFNFATTQHPGTAETLYRTYKGVTYHPLGLNSYTIPVRHFGHSGGTANDPRDIYGFYGVVRNNMYTVTINSITGPGNGIYDWDNRFLSAEISITPWYRRKQGVDLGYE